MGHRLLLIILHTIAQILLGEEYQELHQLVLPLHTTVPPIIHITTHRIHLLTNPTMVILRQELAHHITVVPTNMDRPLHTVLLMVQIHHIIMHPMDHHLTMDVIMSHQEWAGDTMICNGEPRLLCPIMKTLCHLETSMACIMETILHQLCTLSLAALVVQFLVPIHMILA
jgi:hypothetical protein